MTEYLLALAGLILLFVLLRAQPRPARRPRRRARRWPWLLVLALGTWLAHEDEPPARQAPRQKAHR